MSFIDCVKELKLPPRKIKEIEEKYTRTKLIFKNNGMTAEAGQLAASRVYNAELEIALQKKRNTIRHVNAVKSVWAGVENRVKTKQENWDKLLKDRPILRKITESKTAGWLFYKPTFNHELQNYLIMIDNVGRGIERGMQFELAEVDGALDIMRPDTKMGGYSDEKKAKIRELWKAAGGMKVEDAKIQKAGEDLRRVYDTLTDLYIANGGVMNKLENWMPQMHSPAAVRAAGFETWYADINNKLDWSKIVDEYQLPINPENRQQYLKNIYDTIESDGMNILEQKGAAGKSQTTGSSMSAKRSQHRTLHFINPEAQLDYNAKYGTDNLTYIMSGHIQNMARDISILQHMGPNPDSMLANWELRLAGGKSNKPKAEALEKKLSELVKKNNESPSKELSEEIKKVQGEIDTLKIYGEQLDPFNKKMYDVLLGRTSMTGNESEAYKFLTGTQGLMRAAQLGSAVIPAFGDSLWTGVAARFSGLPVTDSLGNYAKLIRLGKKDAIKEAKMSAYVADAALGNVLRNYLDDGSFVTKSRMNRGYSTETTIGKIRAALPLSGDAAMVAGQNLSTGVMRVSGLSWLTEHAKESISMTAFGKTAIEKSKNWADLNPDYRTFMENVSGMTERDWAEIQKSQATKLTNDDVEFLFPSDIKDRSARDKYSGYIEALRMLATNEPNLKTKTVTTQGARAGTIERAMWNQVFMYRAFPISLLNNYIRQLATRQVLRNESGQEMIGILALAMISGYLTMSIKDALNNKTPRDLDKSSTWKQAALQSGALSIFDFAIQDHNRYGGSMAQTFMGPMAGFYEDTWKVGAAALTGWEDGGEEFRNKGFGYLKRYTPGQSLWWIRSGGQYGIMGLIDGFFSSDEDYLNRQRSAEKVMKAQGQDYIYER